VRANGFLVFRRGGVQEHGSKRSRFPANSFSGPRIVAYRHFRLLDPVTGFIGIKTKELGGLASGSAPRCQALGRSLERGARELITFPPAQRSQYHG
jgi:hypothetical protein